jgi:hypothetical protein
MILSIHQPGYFPWLGLLDKISRSDALIVLDEVQLSDSLYQHRNLFATADGPPKFLTIPIVKKGYRGLSFRDIQIASADWRVRHRNFLWNSYRKHAFADEVMPRVETYFRADYSSLCDAVVASMRLSLEFFGINSKVIFQSDMDYDRSLRRGDLILSLVRATGATCYLSGAGAKAYLDESAFSGDLSLRYNAFKHPVYPQKGGLPFQEGLSCLDALFNLGVKGARSLIGGDAR